MPVETELVVKEALDNLRVAMEESGARITKDPLPMVMGDPVQLLQLFQNLIGNAIKYRKKEVTPEVQISAERKKNQWLFGIHDNGIGIEPQYHDKIFVIFQRLHQRRNTREPASDSQSVRRSWKIMAGWSGSSPLQGKVPPFILPFRRKDKWLLEGRCHAAVQPVN